MTNEEQMTMMDDAWKDVEAHAIEGNPYLFAKAFNQAVNQRQDERFEDTPSSEADANDVLDAYKRIVKRRAIMNELERQQARNRHYKAMQHEPIEVMRDWLTHDQFIGFCLGNAIKYLSRYNAEFEKGGILNIDKAIDYLEWIQESTTEC